jgi:hypothetical protein
VPDQSAEPFSPPTGIAISPAPSDAEAAAVIAAAEVLMPRSAPSEETVAQRSRSWRFSGRWWTRPVAARRERPFR